MTAWTLLPPAARARLEQVLANAELAYGAARDKAAKTPESSGRWGFSAAPYGVPQDQKLQIVLGVLAVTAEVATAQEWPADQRRALFDEALAALPARFDLEQPPVMDALRATLWWRNFQRTLSAAPRTDIPSLAQQLSALRAAVRWTIEELAEKVKLDKRTVERHLSGKKVPKPGTLKVYEAAFSAEQNRPVSLSSPPRTTRRRTAGKKPAKRR